MYLRSSMLSPFESLNPQLSNTRADNVLAGELNHLDWQFVFVSKVHSLTQTRLAVEVCLFQVSTDNQLAVFTDPGEEHFHLTTGHVLRLVNDYEGVVERATAHI